MELLEGLMGHSEAQQAHQMVYGNTNPTPEHTASLTHEIIAGAAGFEAVRAYENRVRQSGETPSHSLMKEILGGIAGAEINKLVETKGLDFLDAEKAKVMAVGQAGKLAEERFAGGTIPLGL